MTAETWSVEINAQNFQTEVAEKSRQLPVLLEFYAEGAQQCAATSAFLQKLVAEYQGKILLARVEAQQNPQLAQQLQIRVLPSVKIVFQGQIVGGIDGQVEAGKAEAEQIKAALDELTLSPMERIREQLDFLLAQGERKQAIQMLQQAIAEEPRNFGLHVELCDLLVQEGEIAEARKLLEALPEDAEGVEKPISRLEFIDLAEGLGSLEELTRQAENGDLQDRFNLAIRQLVEDQVEAGLEILMAIMQTDKTWEDEKARKAMIKVFNMLGKGNELATTYRRKMFTWLH